MPASDPDQSRSILWSPRPGTHHSTTSLVPSLLSPVMTTSAISAMNSSPSGPASEPGALTGPAAKARPLILASPGHSFSFP